MLTKNSAPSRWSQFFARVSYQTGFRPLGLHIQLVANALGQFTSSHPHISHLSGQPRPPVSQRLPDRGFSHVTSYRPLFVRSTGSWYIVNMGNGRLAKQVKSRFVSTSRVDQSDQPRLRDGEVPQPDHTQGREGREVCSYVCGQLLTQAGILDVDIMELSEYQLFQELCSK